MVKDLLWGEMQGIPTLSLFAKIKYVLKPNWAIGKVASSNTYCVDPFYFAP